MKPKHDSIYKGAMPTIYDVADLAGLSIATVSRVLNSPEKVSSLTRDRVLAAIDELGFVPKAEARARAMQKSRRIGVLAPYYFTAPSFVQRLRGIEASLRDDNYELIIYTVSSRYQMEGYLATLPLTGHLDGLIVMCLMVEDDLAARVARHGLEAVLIEYHSEVLSSIEIDDHAGGRMAAEYLLSRGHRRLAFLGDMSNHEYAVHPINKRLAGFRQALEEAGLELPEEYIRHTPYMLENTLAQAHALFKLHPIPTAVFAAADFQATAVIRAAGECGLRVPDDVAVIGFDDLDLADFTGLSTIRQPLDDSGRIAVELLWARLEDPNRPAQHIKLPLKLVVRHSA